MILKKVWAFLIVMSVVLFVLSVLTVKVESTVTHPYSVVEILSPTSTTYSSRSLILNVTFTHGPLDYTLTYNLDSGENNYAIPYWVYNPNNEMHVAYSAYGSIKLPALSDGSHSLTVTLVSHVHYSGGGKPGAPFQPISPGSSEYQAVWTDSVTFTVSSDEPHEPQPPVDVTPLEILDLSVEDQTYVSNNVTLNFIINGDVLQIAYSLDGRHNVTILGNTTLYASLGTHNITVFAWDEFGKTCNPQTGTFSVLELANEEPQQIDERFPTATVASVVSAVVFSVGILFYLRKRIHI
jgi:hypothetical protein